MARQDGSTNRAANVSTDPPASGRERNLALRSRAPSKGREANSPASGMSGSSAKLGDRLSEPGALRPLAKALIDLALSMLAEENREEEKAA